MSEFRVNNNNNTPNFSTSPLRAEVSVEFINSVMREEAKFRGKVFNEDAAKAAEKRFYSQENKQDGQMLDIREGETYKAFYQEEVEKRNGITFEEFARSIKDFINKRSRNSYSIGHDYIAKEAFSVADKDIVDNKLNNNEKELALNYFNKKLNEVTTNSEAFAQLFKNLNPDLNETIAEYSAKRSFKAEQEENYLFGGEESDPISLKSALRSSSDNYDRDINKAKNIEVNGKFDKHATQQTGNCHPHAYINALSSSERGSEYLESLIKVDDDGSVYVYLPGNGKQYHYTKEELFTRSSVLSTGDYDVTAIMCAIEDARIDASGNENYAKLKEDPWYNFEGIFMSNLAPDTLLLNYNGTEERMKYLSVEEMGPEIIMYKSTGGEILANFAKYKNNPQDSNNGVYFKNDLFEIINTEYDWGKQTRIATVKFANGKTQTVTAKEFESLRDEYDAYEANKELIESFNAEQNKTENKNSLFFNSNYTVTEVKNTNEIVVKTNTGEEKIINKKELENMHQIWKKEDNEKKAIEAKNNRFYEMQRNLKEGKECFVFGTGSQIIKDIDGKEFLPTHALAIVDFIDMEHIQIKDSNYPDEARFITYDEFLKISGLQQTKVPEPVKWEIKK